VTVGTILTIDSELVASFTAGVLSLFLIFLETMLKWLESSRVIHQVLDRIHLNSSRISTKKFAGQRQRPSPCQMIRTAKRLRLRLKPTDQDPGKSLLFSNQIEFTVSFDLSEN